MPTLQLVQRKKGSVQGRTLTVYDSQVLTDESLICVFHVACRYVRSSLATVINRAGCFVANCSTGDRKQGKVPQPYSTWGLVTTDGQDAGAASALPSFLLNPPLGDTQPTQPTALKGLATNSPSENSQISDLV